MMNAKYDLQTLSQVASMYYTEDKSQMEIAGAMKCSRSMVSMMLTEAKEIGLIEFRVKKLTDNVEELAEKLKASFKLKSCFVVPTSATTPEIVNRIVAMRAGNIVQEYFTPHKTIGVSWGETCSLFMRLFPESPEISHVTVVPMVGGTATVSREYRLNEMVRMFAEKINGIPKYIHAPAYADSEEDRREYMKSDGMKNISGYWDKMDIAVVTMGGPPNYYISSELENPYETAAAYRNDKNKAVGDILARRINVDGEFIQCSFNDRVVGATPKQLKKVKDVFAVAAGRHKVLSVLGGLKTGVLNHLITDENTARGVLSFVEQEQA